MKWATTDDLGILAFTTKADAHLAFPESRAVRCEFAMGFYGWLALDPHGTDNGSVVWTPDGGRIPVVSGYSSEHGKLIGMRGGVARTKYANDWRAIMSRVIQAGLVLNEYKRAGGNEIKRGLRT